MAQNLSEYLDEHKCQGFKPIPHYFPDGDFITYYSRDARCHARQVDDLLTVYLALETDELIGCKIAGVKQILETAGHFGLALDGANVRLGFFLFVGAVWARDDAKKQLYEELRRLAQDVKMSGEELQAVGD